MAIASRTRSVSAAAAGGLVFRASRRVYAKVCREYTHAYAKCLYMYVRCPNRHPPTNRAGCDRPVRLRHESCLKDYVRRWVFPARVACTALRLLGAATLVPAIVQCMRSSLCTLACCRVISQDGTGIRALAVALLSWKGAPPVGRLVSTHIHLEFRSLHAFPLPTVLLVDFRPV